MISAQQVYATAVRYWHERAKHIDSDPKEPKEACPGIGTLQVEDKALLAATIYLLANLPDDESTK